jgi:type I restriction enzyme S subunit
MMQLLKHFKELTLHPKNAEELKGLILQLAVQGKLTKKWREENPDVEPASVLLEKIEVEKQKLIKAKKIKKEKLEPLLESEFYFDIPNNWEWQRLGNIGFIFNGDSINASVKEAEYSNLESGYPYIATKDVGYIFDPINHENGIKIPFNESKFKIVRKETVLICSEGGSAGKKMGIVNQDCCFGNKLFAIEQYGGIESKFILSLYGSSSFSEAFKENMTGIIGGISRNSFANIYIPIPPLEEQKAIVEVVNQLFAEVEQLEVLTKGRIQLKADFVTSALNQLTQAAEQDTASQWDFLQSQFGTFFTEKGNIKKLREAILQLAVQGKLTHHWRAAGKLSGVEVESASELLEKIKAEKEMLIKAGKIKKEKLLSPISEEETPCELPDGWIWCRLEDLTSITGGVTKGKLNQKNLVNTPYLRVANVQRGYLELGVMKEILVSKSDYNKYQLQQNDLLMIEGGDPDKVGRCAIWSNEFPGCIYQNHVFRVRPYLNSTMNNHFFMLFINSRVTRDYYESCAKRTTNLASINKTQMRSTPIAFPPLGEQTAIVEKVNSLIALCDRLEQEIENHQTTQEQWMQSCLREEVKN